MSYKITNFTQIKEIIEPIPKEQFIAHKFVDKVGNCCFLGHINMHFNKSKSMTEPCKAVAGDGYGARELTAKFLKDKLGYNFSMDGSHINNSECYKPYTEKEIKDRVMHMINDAIAAGY
jgi:hypothetical protein